jgi:large subunit ribosomal protein L6
MSSTITSRVARKPVTIPTGVQVSLLNSELHVKGKMGHISLPISPDIQITIKESILTVNITKTPRYSRSGSGKKQLNAIPGTTRAQIQNAVYGVTNGFECKLQLVGVGYKAQLKGKNLDLALGLSHSVIFMPEEGITFETPSATEILVKGIRKDLVGHVASKIRAIRPPEPYKGKGVRYANEEVVRKETKKK